MIYGGVSVPFQWREKNILFALLLNVVIFPVYVIALQLQCLNIDFSPARFFNVTS